MTLKQIPIEDPEGQRAKKTRGAKHFNPGQRISPTAEKSVNQSNGVSLKEVCVHLVHFINRGSRYSVEQLEKIISDLQRSVLTLQKKKTEMVRTKHNKGKKKSS